MENSFGVTGFVFNSNYDWENAGEGVRRKILAYEKDLMLIVTEFKKGAIGSIHKHPHKQVSYLERGSFEVTINEEKKVMKAGDSYLVPTNVEHGVVALEDSVLVDVFTPYREEFVKK
jgi:quercetin dioxygenase-like cupin family protein